MKTIKQREKPFQSPCHISGNEKEMLLNCLESLSWSGFRAGYGDWDIRELLALSSAEAQSYGPDQVRFLGGRHVRDLEALYAAATETRFAVSANSATSALIMALSALDLGPGDEVLVPTMSFHASATAIVHARAIPVFVEIKEDTLCMDPLDMEAKITDKTKAVMVVHLGGNTADMDAVMHLARKYNLSVVEDCAQAPGVSYKQRSVGSIGHVGVFSLTETKNISCGEGGVLVTNNPRVAFKARLIRNHGESAAAGDWSDEELINIVGMNYRLTELQAALAIPQFQDLSKRNRIRRENAAHLFNGLARFSELVPQKPEVGADYVCYIAKWRYLPRRGKPGRDQLVADLAAMGIPMIAGYQRMMHESPLYTRGIAFGPATNTFPAGPSGQQRYGCGACPRSEAVNKQLLWFCFVHPPQTREDMDDVVRAFAAILQ